MNARKGHISAALIKDRAVSVNFNLIRRTRAETARAGQGDLYSLPILYLGERHMLGGFEFRRQQGHIAIECNGDRMPRAFKRLEV